MVPFHGVGTDISSRAGISRVEGHRIGVHYAIPDDDFRLLIDKAVEHPEVRSMVFYDASLLTESSVADLARAPNVEGVLFYKAQRLGDGAAARIGGMKHMRGISLDDSKLTDKGLASLALNASLIDVSVSGCTGISGAGLLQLVSLRNLRGLSIGGCTQLSAPEIAAVIRMLKMEYISIGGLRLSDEVGEAILSSTTLKSVTAKNVDSLSQDVIDRLKSRPGLWREE
jgi:hypothetical protein